MTDEEDFTQQGRGNSVPDKASSVSKSTDGETEPVHVIVSVGPVVPTTCITVGGVLFFTVIKIKRDRLSRERSEIKSQHS